ncbi:iron ABC transporter permease [Devosia sp. FKR38]|uniref:FecCD family ABC transporter permease n=1 Tax=Devosia sp. FKR38 TaxID=2562312 RepID=UPI0020BFB558|nr:iron ABC transporter permease [Devosia sp. FKR38]
MAGSARWFVLRLFGERLALRLPVPALVWLTASLVLLGAVLAYSLTTGSQPTSLEEVWRTLTGETVSRAIDNVIWEFRFPRALAAALVGAMFALSGAALQNVTRNGLADPSLVGVSQGAGLAVVALTVLWPASLAELRPFVAFAGSMLVALLIQGLTWTARGASSVRFILMGVGVAALISAGTSVLMTYGEIEKVLSVLTWLNGSINAANWDDVYMLAGWSAVLLPMLLLLSRATAALRMGEATAAALGAPVRWVRYGLITTAVGFAAIGTAVVGPLGFVGLIAPHAARRLAPSGVGLHLLLTATLGAVLVSLADLVGRSLLAPVQIPAGLLTDLIGVPIFLILLRRAARGNAL